MKKLMLLSIVFLNGCFYYSEGCLYTPQYVSCVDKGKLYPAIAHYQKPTSIGKTDSIQRWKDAVSCGAVDGDIELNKIPYDHYKFRSCMESKGYKRFTPTECGYQNPKWDKGVCNL